MYKTLSQYNKAQIVYKNYGNNEIENYEIENYENKENKKEKNKFVSGLVSVIIPTYNRYKNLVHAIKSVLEQTYKNVEIIVINDCSTEKEYKSGNLEKMEKVRVIHLPVNLRKKYNVKAAQGKTRDEGIKIAKGEWIAFLDDDDYWLPQKLEKQMKILKEKPKIFMSSTNMLAGPGLYDKNKKYGLFAPRDILPNIITKKMIENDNKIYNSTVILHKNIINKVGEFDLGNYEDWEYWKRSLKHTDCYYINEPLVYYDNNHAGQKHYG